MIYIDASRYNNTALRTGVENYSYYLLNTLVRSHPSEITLLTPRTVDLPVPQRVIPLSRLWTQLRLSWELWRHPEVDNLFVPSHVLPFFCPRRSVMTIHDVAFRRFPDSYSSVSRWYLHWTTAFAVRHAARIIVPSQATKDDLVHFYSADAQKIYVIPHGHSSRPSALSAVLSQQLALKRYFLYVGRIESKKNLVLLIQAFRSLLPDHPDIHLILAGKDGVGSQAIHAAAEGEHRIVFTGYIDEATKSALYQNAWAFVFPSLYEGFGFPLLEAMEYHLPIIASDIPASREVAEGAALFFDPSSFNELRQHLERVIQVLPDTTGYDQILSRYSWERCAEATWSILTTQ